MLAFFWRAGAPGDPFRRVDGVAVTAEVNEGQPCTAPLGSMLVTDVVVHCAVGTAKDVEQYVQHQGTDRGHGDTAVGDGLHPLWHLGKELRTHHGDQPEADAHGNQQLVAAVADVRLLKNLDPGGGDHAEHGDGRAPSTAGGIEAIRKAALGSRLSRISSAPATMVT